MFGEFDDDVGERGRGKDKEVCCICASTHSSLYWYHSGGGEGC